jgi:hypothetical protein
MGGLEDWRRLAWFRLRTEGMVDLSFAIFGLGGKGVEWRGEEEEKRRRGEEEGEKKKKV